MLKVALAFIIYIAKVVNFYRPLAIITRLNDLLGPKRHLSYVASPLDLSYQKKLAAEQQVTAAATPVVLPRWNVEVTENPFIEHYEKGPNSPCPQGDLHSWFLTCLCMEDAVDGKVICSSSSSSSRSANQLAAHAH